MRCIAGVVIVLSYALANTLIATVFEVIYWLTGIGSQKQHSATISAVMQTL